MVGSSFPYSEWLPEPGQARAVQIDIDAAHDRDALSDGDQPRRRQRRDPASADPAAARARSTVWRETIEDNVRRWWEILDAQAHETADPLNPQLLFHELSKRLPDQRDPDQ